MNEWKEYTGSDAQIAEMRSNKYGYILRFKDGRESGFSNDYFTQDIERLFRITTHYLLCTPHQLAKMICQQALTGQPVYIKMKSSTYWVIAMRGFDLIYQDHVVSVIKSTIPDWNIPNAEYRFAPFEEGV